MALFVRQNDNRSQLQERLASELQEKAKKRAQENNGMPDGVEDSKYIQDSKPSAPLPWKWVIAVLAGAGVVVIIYLYTKTV